MRDCGHPSWGLVLSGSVTHGMLHRPTRACVCVCVWLRTEVPLRVGRAERSASRACVGLVPWRLRSNRRTGPDCSMVASPTATRTFLRGRERRLHGRQREKSCGRAGGSACSRCGAPSHARPTPRGAPPSQAPATMLHNSASCKKCADSMQGRCCRQLPLLWIPCSSHAWCAAGQCRSRNGFPVQV